MAAAALVVLDLDGTLARLDVDWAALRAGIRELAARAGLQPRAGGVLGMLDELTAAGCGAAPAALASAAEARAAQEAPLNASLLAWLAGQAAGSRCAVLTLNGRAAAHVVLERAAAAAPPLAGATVVAREDVRARKPDPEGLVAILEAHGVAAHDALFVGDADSDAACAAAAGVPWRHVREVGVDWAPFKRPAGAPITGTSPPR